MKLHLLINHANKTVQVFSRKLNATYKHVSYKRGQHVSYKEVSEGRQFDNITKGFSVKFVDCTQAGNGVILPK